MEEKWKPSALPKSAISFYFAALLTRNDRISNRTKFTDPKAEVNAGWHRTAAPELGPASVQQAICGVQANLALSRPPFRGSETKSSPGTTECVCVHWAGAQWRFGLTGLGIASDGRLVKGRLGPRRISIWHDSCFTAQRCVSRARRDW